MPRNRQVIRVIILGNNHGDYFGHRDDHHSAGELLQVLEHARPDAIKLHKPDGDRQDKYIIDIYPPERVDSMTWARMESERMRSFGYNAVPAPEWKE